MAKKATRLMREATYRWCTWRAEGTPGEVDLACRLARQALAWAERQRQPVLTGQARRLVEALERHRREYDVRCRPPEEAAARAQEIIPADELEAGTVREAPAPLYVPEGVFFVRGERVWNVRTGRAGVVVADAGREDTALVILWDGDQTPQRIDSRDPEADAIHTAEPCTVREPAVRYTGAPRWILAQATIRVPLANRQTRPT